MSLQPEHGYVIAVALSSYFVNTYMQMGVMSARKKYGVKYPCLYATENDTKQHKEFNCVQRAHQNFLENVPFYFMLQTISAAANPKASAILGAIYLLGRVFYFRGYSSGNPDKRMQGGFQYIGLLGMLGLGGKLAYDLIKQAL